MTVYILWFNALGTQSIVDIYYLYQDAQENWEKMQLKLPKFKEIFRVDCSYTVEERQVM